MSEYKYTKSYAADFGSNLRNNLLVDEIEADPGVAPTCLRVDRYGDVVDIVFDSEPSAGEKTTIDGLIAAHFTLPFVAGNMKFMTIDSTYSPFQIKQYSLKCDTSSGNITVNLVKAARDENACFIIHKIAAANTVTIDPYGSETIGGNPTHTLTALNDYVHFQSDGTNWIVITTDNPLDEAANILDATITDTKGDLIADDGNMHVHLSVGSDGQVLMADSAASAGLAYAGLTSISGYVANEHIDHSAVTLTAGVALAGGGDLTANRTFDLDINSLTAEATVDGAADYVVVYDASVPAHRKVLLNDLPATGGGESNTGANVGTGSGWYRDKTGSTLNFKTLVAGSTKLSVVANADDLTVDVDQSNIDHGSLAGLADDDHTQYALLAGRSGGQSIIGGTATGDDLTLTSTSDATKGTIILSDPVAANSYLEFTDISAPTNPGAGLGRLYKKTGDDGIFWKPDAAGPEVDLTSTGVDGETNTASNVGVGGVGTFKQKTGVDLEFRSINAASNKITVALDAGNNEIDIDAAPDNIMPGTTKGDLIVHSGSTHVREAVGSNDDVLVSDSTAPNGVKWAKLTASSLARDLQQTNMSNTVSTTSTTFVDMPNMSLTTSNTNNSEYIVSFTGNVTVSNANRSITIIANIGGTDVTAVQLDTASPSSGKFTPITFQYKHPTPLGNGVVIKIRWKVTNGEATITAKNRILIIDGS